MEKKCCGNCKRFENEDIDGFGWCIVALAEVGCNHSCPNHEFNNNGWTEITPDNVDDVLKAKEMSVIAHYVDKRLIKEILPADVDNNQLEKILSTMAELGGYYYYILPELKIDGLSKFEKKCLALTIGYDHDVCDGKYCKMKLTCLRYMLYTKAILEDRNGCLSYIGKTFNDNCYLKYDS